MDAIRKETEHCGSLSKLPSSSSEAAFGKPAESITQKLVKKARASYRLFKMFFITIYYMSLVAANALIKGNSLKRASLYGQKWAKTLTNSLNVEVKILGEPPAEASLLIANHRSYIDIPAVILAVPCAFLAKAEVARWPILGRAAKIGNTVFVERQNRESRKQSRKSVAEIAVKGVSAVVFPEGTTHEGPGILPLRPGIFGMAAESALGVVPIAIEYGDKSDAWIGDDTFIRHFMEVFGKEKLYVCVRFGPVFKGSDADELRLSCQKWIEENLVNPLSF